MLHPPADGAPISLDDLARRLTAPGRAHLLGASGSGMQALGQWLDQSGWTLTRHDDAEPGGPSGASVASSSAATLAFPAGRAPDLVLHSAAVPAEHPQFATARRFGWPCASYPQALAALSRRLPTVALAGTHGKSTTLALLDAVLRAAGRDPHLLCGARPLDGGPAGRAGRDPLLLVEACEYRGHFLELAPRWAAVTGVEWDHVDCYPSHAAVVESFARFAELVPPEGLLVLPADEPRLSKALGRTRARLVTCGEAAAATWRAEIEGPVAGAWRWRLVAPGGDSVGVALGVIGRHQVANALTAAALAGELGVEPRDIARGLEGFRGLSRRLEWRGRVGPVDIYDDYAHHPTALAAGFAALAARHPGRRIVAVFEPHQVSRTRALVDEWAASFDNAGLTLVAEAFPAREPADADVRGASRLVVDRLTERGLAVVGPLAMGQLAAELVGRVRPDDVVALIGAGRMGRETDGIVERLRRHFDPS